MDRDIILRKLDSLARCVRRIEEKRPATLEQLMEDIDIQDILSINLERAVQVAVDIGAHLIAGLSVPPPKTMGEVFAVLSAENLIPEETGLVSCPINTHTFAGESFGDFQGASEAPVSERHWPSEQRGKSPKASRSGGLR